jgi:hypothetical protein
LTAGWGEFIVEPDPVIPECSIVIPSVKGAIKSSFKASDDEFILNLTVPEGTQATVVLPEKYQETKVNGIICEEDIKLKAGEYEIVCR